MGPAFDLALAFLLVFFRTCPGNARPKVVSFANRWFCPRFATKITYVLSLAVSACWIYLPCSRVVSTANCVVPGAMLSFCSAIPVSRWPPVFSSNLRTLNVRYLEGDTSSHRHASPLINTFILNPRLLRHAASTEMGCFA